MDTANQKQRIEAALKILHEESTRVEKLESILMLLRGINPKIDNLLASCAKSLSALDKLQRREVIELAAENLPSETDEEKRRKKAILFLIKNLKDLKGELERVKKELAKSEGIQTPLNIAALAKGPLGLMTALALVIVLALFVLNTNRDQSRIQTTTATPLATPLSTPAMSAVATPTPIPKSTIQVINFNGKKIPISELAVRTGSDCTKSPLAAPHYHAREGYTASAIDGTAVTDPNPGSCGYGKVEDVAVEEVEAR